MFFPTFDLKYATARFGLAIQEKEHVCGVKG